MDPVELLIYGGVGALVEFVVIVLAIRVGLRADRIAQAEEAAKRAA